jgi:hypothetical protein
VSREQQIEIVCLSGNTLNTPTPDEISLISTMLPELLLLIQRLGDSDED